MLKICTSVVLLGLLNVPLAMAALPADSEHSEAVEPGTATINAANAGIIAPNAPTATEAAPAPNEQVASALPKGLPMVTVPYNWEPDPWIVPFDERDLSDPKDWKSKFEIVVVVDKNPHVQRAKMFKQTAKGPVLIKEMDVSTGRDHLEFPNPGNIDKEDSLQSDGFSRTFTGYYVPKRLEVMAYSDKYKNAPMAHAIWFDPDNGHGEAMHQAPPGTERKIGHTASGACVRLRAKDAYDAFWEVRKTGGKLTPVELANTQFMKEYQDQQEETAKLAEKYELHTTEPSIPVFDVHGVASNNPDGTPQMRTLTRDEAREGKHLFNTLYVIEDTSKPQGRPTNLDP